MLRLALASILLVPALASCNVYDPDLPPVPYCCGGTAADGFICPDGYRAVIRPSNETGCGAPFCQCEEASGLPPIDGGADSGPFACADDSAREPNNNISEATPTVVGMGSNSQIFNGMALCPASDVDVFRMTVSIMDTGIEVVVDFAQLSSDVEVDILNSGGDSIASGSSAGAGRMRAFTTAGVTGTYYAQVKSGNNTENNYAARLMVTPP